MEREGEVTKMAITSMVTMIIVMVTMATVFMVMVMMVVMVNIWSIVLLFRSRLVNKLLVVLRNTSEQANMIFVN